MSESATQQVYSRDWEVYSRSDIMPEESRLLEIYKTKWPTARVLDIGIGAGRTTWVFGNIANEYVGVDLVPEMVEICRRNFGENAHRRFSVADASNLKHFEDSSFDVVMFSYNGIDHLSPEGRLKFLSEARRVLRPKGILYFSSHNLGVLPHNAYQAWRPSRNPLRWLREIRHIRHEIAFFKNANALATSDETRKKGWCVLPDVSHNGVFTLYYISPDAQDRQLEEAGFDLKDVWNVHGKPVVDLTKPSEGWWIAYHAIKK